MTLDEALLMIVDLKRSIPREMRIFHFCSGVNNFLTGVLWGYETDEGDWKWVSTHPSLQKPENCASCITYFKYLENQIVKEAIDRKDLRAKTGSFIYNEGAPFRQFYDALIESLRYHRLGTENRKQEDDLLSSTSPTGEHARAPVTVSPLHKRRFSILHLNEVPVNGFRSANGTLYHYILPSFFRLIQHLQDTNREFVIYLRTMGDDSKNFLHNAERVLSNEHPSFQYEKAVVINHEPGRITRPNGEHISLQMKFPEDSDPQVIDDEFLIHEKLVSATGVHAIKDDFNAWCQTNYHFTTSKPVWFDPDDPDPPSHHILFDDNFRVIDPNDSIVDIRIMDRETRKCRSCAFEFYPVLENIFAVQADLYLILAQPDYYINRVEECEAKLDKLLKNKQLLHAIKTKSFAD